MKTIVCLWHAVSGLVVKSVNVHVFISQGELLH